MSQLAEFKKQEPKRVNLTLECTGCMVLHQRKGPLSFSHLCNLCVHLLCARQGLATGGSAGTRPMWFLAGCCLEGEWKRCGGGTEPRGRGDSFSLERSKKTAMTFELSFEDPGGGRQSGSTESSND